MQSGGRGALEAEGRGKGEKGSRSLVWFWWGRVRKVTRGGSHLRGLCGEFVWINNKVICFVCMYCSLRLHRCLIILNENICSLLASKVNFRAALCVYPHTPPLAIFVGSYLGCLTSRQICCVYCSDDEWEADFGCGLIIVLYTQGGFEKQPFNDPRVKNCSAKLSAQHKANIGTAGGYKARYWEHD